MGGELPCSKEEAAILAAISMRLDDAWPHSQARMSTQSASLGHSGPGHPAGQAIAEKAGGAQVSLTVTSAAAADHHSENAAVGGHSPALDESDGEREHERMLSEFLNKHRKLDRSIVCLPLLLVSIDVRKNHL